MDVGRVRRFEGQLDKLRSYPKRYGKRLSGPVHGLYQLRFDDSFRIWYTVEAGTVQVRAIKHKDDAVDHY